MRIGFIGDIVLSPNLIVDQYLLDKLNGTDINVANLEAPFINESILNSQTQGGLFQLENNCSKLHQLNIAAVSLANNHIFDFDIDGFEETISVLEVEGLKYFGAGRHIKEASSMLELEIEGCKIAIGGFVSRYLVPGSKVASESKPGVAPVLDKYIRESLGNSNADVKILFNHWNQEFEDYPEPLFKEQAETFTKYCDCIISSHTHGIQGGVSDKGKFIFHGLGNFSVPHVKYHKLELKKYPAKCYDSFFLILNIVENRIVDYEQVYYSISENGMQISRSIPEHEESLRLKYKLLSEPLELGRREYRRFYGKHKIRKFRLTLQRSHWVNLSLLWLISGTLKLISRGSVFVARVLGFLGLRNFVRRRFSKLLSKLFKL